MKKNLFIFWVLAICFIFSNTVVFPAYAVTKNLKNSEEKTLTILDDEAVAENIENTETTVTIAKSVVNEITAEEKAFATAVKVGAYAYDITKKMSYEMGSVKMPLGEAWRPAGSPAEHEAANFLKTEMEKIGLKSVQKEGFSVHGYTFGGASVQILNSSSSPKMLATGFGGISGTAANGLSAPIVYVGLGGKADYEGKNVKGKIVLVDIDENEMNWLHIPYAEAEFQGASALIVHWVGYQMETDSIVSFDSVSRPAIPVVGVSHENFDILKTASANGSTVKIVSDVKTDLNSTSYNVVGYLPGTVKSDQLIVIGAHYDKWWYGATDNSAGIGQMLSLAKSLINSGYKPNHTIAFVAFGAEEYGWTSTNFDWLIGSYSHLKRNHPDWPGKTLAFFNFDDGAGLLGAKTILANGSPETYNFRKNMTSVFDNYFSHTLPWSAYYLPAKAVYNLPSTDFDEFSFGSAGISTMNVISTDSQIDFDSVYHTQLDNMDIISAESLGLATIANGLTVIRLDRSNILPYNLENWATDLSQQLEFKKIKTMGIDIKPINSAIQEFKKVASRVWTKIQNSNSTKKDQINSLLLDAEKKLASALVTVGGYDEALYPHEQYQTDAWALKSAQDALVKNDLETALDSLQEVYGLYEGVKVSRPVYKEMVINRHNSNRSDLFWATGKLARFIDFYDQYFLIEENGNTRKNMTLIRVAFDQAVKNLTGAINTEIAVLNQATALLLALEKLLP